MWQKGMVILGVLFAGLILVISVMRTSEDAAYAHIADDELRPTHAPVQTALNQVEAGHLPGHPLYLVKMIRQQVVGWRANAGKEKAVHYLRLATDRLDTATGLKEAGEIEKGMKTVTKGVGYLTLAADELARMENETSRVQLWAELATAGYLYEDILDEYKTVAVGHEDAAMDELCKEIERVLAQTEQLVDQS